MKNIIHQLRANCLAILAGMFLLTSCNKALEEFPPIPTPVYPSGPGIAATLAANPNYSNYAALIARAGMTALLNDSTKTFTLFATDNNGMNLFATAQSGGVIPYPAPTAAVLGFVNSLPVASAAGIVQYNTVGQKYPFATIPSVFPNWPITSQIILDATQPFVRMPIFPDRGTPNSYVNTMPVIATDLAAANGVIHTTFSIVAPLPAQPLTTIKTVLNADANLSYFRAAIARGDSGQVGISGVGAYGLKFDSLMNYPVTNMTVLAPNNAACQAIIFGFVYSALIAQGVPAPTAFAQATAAASSPAGFNALPVSVVRGVVAYHIFASNNTGSYKPDIRAFSVNFSPTPGTFVKTLVNGSAPTHPGVMATATFTGPAVTALQFRGAGTFPPGGTPYSQVANATAWDRIAINGVVHVIDAVLLPQ